MPFPASILPFLSNISPLFACIVVILTLVIAPDEEVLREHERQEKLLNITGVTISDTEVRQYPLKEAAAHLIGYVQNVTADITVSCHLRLITSTAFQTFP